MTTPRRYGSDTPFGQWVREQKDLESHQCSFTVNDIDWMFQKYRANVDGLGTRDVQLCMICEVKTFDAEPNLSQREILFYHHQLLNQKRKLKRLGSLPPVSVWHFGVFVLQLRGTYPEEGVPMRWGQFDTRGALIWRMTTHVSSLIEVLGFKRYPDTLTPLSLRRHHKSRFLLCEELTEFGFPVETIVAQRS